MRVGQNWTSFFVPQKIFLLLKLVVSTFPQPKKHRFETTYESSTSLRGRSQNPRKNDQFHVASKWHQKDLLPAQGLCLGREAQSAKVPGNFFCHQTELFCTIQKTSWPLVGNEGMNPQYTNVKVEGPSFPTKGQPKKRGGKEPGQSSNCLTS